MMGGILNDGSDGCWLFGNVQVVDVGSLAVRPLGIPRSLALAPRPFSRTRKGL